MITVFHHEADRVIIEATRVLRELSSHGLLSDIALVSVGDVASPGQPRATCVCAGEDTEVGLFDALATDPATDGHVMTAVASADLAPQAQVALARALARIAEEAMGLANVPVAAICLSVPESRDGSGILPAEGFFSALTANFVALPADWRFVDGMAAAIDFTDAHRSAWHAALEIATLTSSWRAMADSRWRPEIGSPGVAGYALSFVRSSARLVVIRRSEQAAEDFLPVADGFSPAPVPEMVGRTVAVLHPEVFLLDSQGDEPGAPGQRSGVMRFLGAALGSVFPPLAAGFLGFRGLLRAEFSKALGGDVGSGRSNEPSISPSAGDPADGTTVVLEGFEPQVWTDLVRDVLGVADGGGTADAVRARHAAGHQQFVFLTPDSLVDDVLEGRLAGGRSDDASPAPDDANTGAKADADPAEDAGRPQALLTLIDDTFCHEIARAKHRRREQQRELDDLAEFVDRTEKFEPPTALRATVMAFFVTAFVVVASYVLLLDVFDFGDVDQILRTRLAIVATAFTWLVLQYPLAPRSDEDPRAAQSYLLRSAAVVAVVAALAVVFAGPLSDLATGRPWLELVPLLATLVTLGLVWEVLSSESARERPAGRALALAWTIFYVVAGLLLYANMDRSIFNRSEILRQFFERYGDGMRYAAAAVAGFLFLLALVMLAVSDGGNERRRRRARARIRELQGELQRRELLPILRGLRVNWLGTAAALDYILRRNVLAAVASGGAHSDLRSPLLRLALRYRDAYHPSPPPGWLFAQYEAAVDAYATHRAARAGGGGWVRPETSTMVSPIERDLLAAPGSDPRWDFAYRLASGEFDDALAGCLHGAGDGSLEDVEIGFMSEIAPVAPGVLPAGLVGPRAASLGRIAMHSTWWWPDGHEIPDSATHPRAAQIVRSPGSHSYLAVRLDVSDSILERQIVGSSKPLMDPDDDTAPVGPADGLR